MIFPVVLAAAVAFTAPGQFIDYGDWFANRSQLPGKHYILVSAAWCAPCKTIKEDIARDVFPNGIDVAIMDVDKFGPQAKLLLKGRGIPLLIEYTRDDNGKWSKREYAGNGLKAFFGVN